jgi:hypothetical protein
MNRIGVETAFEVLIRSPALEALGRDIIHLEIGEPDYDTSRYIVQAGKQGTRSGLDTLRAYTRAARVAGSDCIPTVAALEGFLSAPSRSV